MNLPVTIAGCRHAANLNFSASMDSHGGFLHGGQLGPGLIFCHAWRPWNFFMVS
jgi:hypothetical protein